MVSLVWHGIFILLVLELAVTLILVLPVPRRIRNWICRKILAYQSVTLKEFVQLPLLFLSLGLVFAVMDCCSSLHYRASMEQVDQDYVGVVYSHPHPHQHHHHHHREKEYKTERNLYLAGFTLTLLLVIVRVLDLMQEHVQLEDECERVKKESKASTTNSTTTSTTSPAATTITGIATTPSSKDNNNINAPILNLIVDDALSGAQIEMTELRKKPLEKKND
jgi:hypothetical protein